MVQAKRSVEKRGARQNRRQTHIMPDLETERNSDKACHEDAKYSYFYFILIFEEVAFWNLTPEDKLLIPTQIRGAPIHQVCLKLDEKGRSRLLS